MGVGAIATGIVSELLGNTARVHPYYVCGYQHIHVGSRACTKKRPCAPCARAERSKREPPTFSANDNRAKEEKVDGDNYGLQVKLPHLRLGISQSVHSVEVLLHEPVTLYERVLLG